MPRMSRLDLILYSNRVRARRQHGEGGGEASDGRLFSAFDITAAASLVADAFGFESIPGLGYTGPTVKVTNADGVALDCHNPAEVWAHVGYKPWTVNNFYSQITGEIVSASTGSPQGNDFNGVMVADTKTSGFVFPASRLSMLSDRPSMAGFVAWAGVWDGMGLNADMLWISTGSSATAAQRLKITSGTTDPHTFALGGRNLDGSSKSGVVTTAKGTHSAVGLVTQDFVGGPLRFYLNGNATPAYENLTYFTGGANCSATTPLSAGAGCKNSGTSTANKGSGLVEAIIFHTAPTGAALTALNARAAAIAGYLDGDLSIIDDGCNTGFSFPLSINLGSSTLIGTVTSRGQQRIYSVNNVSKKIEFGKIVSDTYSGKDDHNAPAMMQTPGGGLITAWTGHGTEGKIRWRRSADLDIRNLGAESAFTIVSGATAAYSQLFTHGTDIWRMSRIGNTWTIFQSTDDGITFPFGGIPLVTSNDDQMYVRAVRVGTDTLRLFCQPNSNYPDESFRICELDFETGDITSGSGVLVSDVFTNQTPAIMEDCTYISNPVLGQKNSFVSVSDDGNMVVTQVADNAFTDVDYYFYKLASGGDPFNQADWSEVLVSNGGPPAGRWAGRIELVNIPGLTNPRVVLGRNDGNTFHIEQYDAVDANGSAWTFTQQLGSGPSLDNQVEWRPYSPKGASSDMQCWWQEGWYDTYTNYRMKLKWKTT